MRYLSFEIENYRAIEEKVTIDLKDDKLIPLVGINECGKTTILQAIYCFDHLNDSEYEGRHLKNIKNLYKTEDTEAPTVTAHIEISFDDYVKSYSAIIAENNMKQKKLIDEETDELKKKDLEKKIYSDKSNLDKSQFNNSPYAER